MNALFEKREEAASAVAQAVALELRSLIATNGRAVFLVDCTSRPLEFFASLTHHREVDWTQVIVFQAAEFAGESPDSPTSCQHFLTEHFLSRVPIITFHPLRADAPNPSAAIDNIAHRLARMPPEIAFMSTELLSTLSAHGNPTETVARLKLGERGALAFTPAVLEQCSLFVLGEASSRRHQLAIGGREQTFLFTNR
jgi:hypothetical protein